LVRDVAVRREAVVDLAEAGFDLVRLDDGDLDEHRDQVVTGVVVVVVDLGALLAVVWVVERRAGFYVKWRYVYEL
ncbi:hypothetical protein AAHH78_32645, partial [Burkholderia pseudomallei]